ncbi:MAG TPA: endo alpha-1,4 polygalactosaminidase [Solirubrobacteraceae bacterium]|nr:endo alpha-1,4 polygalactosaminidase [Solirubrobacteraceae bacterium]
MLLLGVGIGVGVGAGAAAGAGAVTDAGAGGSSTRASVTWWTPPQHLTWFWQLQGTVENDRAVAAYDIDGFENEASEVAALHAQGKRVICYIDAGTAEKFRPDYGEFPAATLGRSNGWPGERWLDIRQLSAIEPIMAARFRMCREKGFDAVEPDNIEAFANKSGFEISPAQQLTYNEWIANEVHALGMAVLQKNDGEQSAQLQPYFDGALSEQCNQYKECGDFQPYLAAGKPVLNAEYRGKLAKFCPADDAAGIMGARFALSLNGKKFEAC